jgi:GAF domain-containing protein/HAMP domain-containing protein
MSSPNTGPQQLSVRWSIRTRLLLLLLGLTTIAVLTVGYLGVNSVQTVGESARETGAEALRAQAEEYLRQVTVGDARRNDLVLNAIGHDTQNVAQYAALVFESPDAFAGDAYWQTDDRMSLGPDGQYANDETDVSSVFVPNFVNVDEEVVAALELGAYLNFVFEPTFESDPNTVAIYLGTEEETTRYFPNVNLGAVLPPDFRVTQRPWYTRAAPESNPDRGVIWSPVYVDATGKGLMVTAAAPVYTGEDDFVGVVGVDVTLKDISASVERTRLLGSGYSFLLDSTGHAIALPEDGYRDILGRPPEPDEIGTDLSEPTTAFAPVLTEMMGGSTGFDSLEVGGREVFVAYAPLESTGWSLANVVETEAVLQAMATLQEELETSTRSLVLSRFLPVGGGILAIMAVIGLLLANRLANPIRRMAVAAQRIGTGQWDAPLPRTGNDEIGVLARAFKQMTQQLREAYASLEQKVAARTRDLQRRSVQLEAASHVAREAAAIRDVEQLLGETVQLISDRFGFYHAGIFLVDDAQEYAVLRAASSQGGQRMLERGHRLAVGKVGMVGYVADTGEPRIAFDVGEDAIFFDNPDLPETRSEMALPLRIQDRIIGVLDVQSKEPAAFPDEDVAVLATMADQVALAIENARLLEEAEERVLEIDTLLGRQAREGWERAVGERPKWGYVYDGVEIVPQEGRTPKREPQFTIPLQIRGEIIGNLHVNLGNRPPTPDERALVQAIANQASQALERARLYDETQRRAAREQLVSEITARVRETLDLETVLKTAAHETREALGVPEVVIRLASRPADKE